MGNSAAHLSCPNSRPPRPGLTVRGQGVVSERRPRRESSLHLISQRLHGRSGDSESLGGRVVVGEGGSWRRRSRKRNTDSESDKPGEESSARLNIV